MADMTPYSTAKPLLSALPQWIADEQERQRIGAYMLYEQIYWTVPQSFKLMSRGEEDNPIYIPSGRVIVETLHRYLANQLTVAPDPAFGDDNQKALAVQVWTDLARRERFYSRFNANKRYGIMRGDWAFHLYADPTKEAGSRISILPVDPASLFPIYNPDNIDEIIGWHIVDNFLDNDGKNYIHRLTYRKATGKGGPSPINVTDEIFEVDDWGGPMMDQDAKLLRAVTPPRTLPSPIDSLPIYVIPNFMEPGNLWGSSEMRGLERIMAAVNQTISDEELALAMEGLGVYATDAGTPVDDDGNDVPWNLGPGRVVELPEGKNMNRITGVSHVVPYQDHLSYLHGQIDEVMGFGAVAKGRVDVTVAESGVAKVMDLAPLLARVGEKEQAVTDVVTNLLYDLGKWYVGYEGTAFNSLLEATRWLPTYGEKLPPNRAEQFDQLMTLVTNQLVSGKYARTKLRQLGYEDMPDEQVMMEEILEEQQISNDMEGARADAAVEEELINVNALNNGAETEEVGV